MYGAFSWLLHLCDLEEQRGGEDEGGFKAIIWGRRERGTCNFYGMQLTTLDNMLIFFRLVIALWLIDDVNHHMHLFLTCTYSRQSQTFFGMSLKNFQVPLKVLHKMVNSFVTHRE